MSDSRNPLAGVWGIDARDNPLAQSGSGSLFEPSSGVAEGLLIPGNINLFRRPRVANADGSISTVRSASFTDDYGRNVLIPTVIEGRGIVPMNEAIKHYYATGQHLGIFDTVDAANAYAEALHLAQQRMYTR